MSFTLPEYHHPDFTRPEFESAPDAAWAAVEADGVAPEYFHSTSMYPEYFKIEENGFWPRKAAWIPALSSARRAFFRWWKIEI